LLFSLCLFLSFFSSSRSLDVTSLRVLFPLATRRSNTVAVRVYELAEIVARLPHYRLLPSRRVVALLERLQCSVRRVYGALKTHRRDHNTTTTTTTAATTTNHNRTYKTQRNAYVGFIVIELMVRLVLRFVVVRSSTY
jgi:hypothetical protein